MKNEKKKKAMTIFTVLLLATASDLTKLHRVYEFENKQKIILLSVSQMMTIYSVEKLIQITHKSFKSALSLSVSAAFIN